MMIKSSKSMANELSNMDDFIEPHAKHLKMKDLEQLPLSSMNSGFKKFSPTLLNSQHFVGTPIE
jgi:hypothetical protein